MDLNELVNELRNGVTYPREEDIVIILTELGNTAGVPPGQREVHVRGEIALLASEIMTLHWGGRLSRAAAEMIEDIAQSTPLTPAQVLGGMVVNGIASTAVHLAPQRGLWLPQCLLQAAEERTGRKLAPAAERWAIPPLWPIPIHQMLVTDLPQYDDLVRRILGATSLKPPIECPGPVFPDDWLLPRRQDLPLRDDLMTLLEMDGHAGMHLLLSSYGTPLIGFAQQIAALSLQGYATKRASGRDWTGVIGFDQQIGTYEETIVALPGWMSACVRSLGLACPAVPNQVSERAEEQLIARYQGSVVQGHGTRLHIFPPDVGAVVRGLAVDWSKVPKV